MSTIFTTKEYCANPNQYASGLTKATIKYYNSICKARKILSSNQLTSDLTKKGKMPLWKSFVEFPMIFLEGLMTPQGLMAMSEFAGAQIGIYVLKNMLYRGIARFSVGVTSEAIGEQVAKKGALFANNAILDSMISDAIDEAASFSIVYSAIEIIGDVLDPVISALTNIRLLGMILDIWDPLGYGNQISASTLAMFTKGYNNAFMKAGMYTVNKVPDAFGNYFFINRWPLEYYADYTILKDKNIMLKDQTTLKFTYIAEYLDALQYNSNGDYIDWSANDGGKALAKSDFDKMRNQMELMIVDQNTVVASWLSRWWPIVVAIVLIIIALLLFIK